MRVIRNAGLLALAVATFTILGTSALANDDEEEHHRDRLSARWWQHAESFPLAVNPIADESGGSCQLGQNGDVWFLHGTFGKTVVRTCTIPTGKKLFFPIVNAICIPFPGETIEQNVEFCSQFIDSVNVRELEVDGKKRNSLIRRRTHSEGFAVTLPEENVFDAPGFDAPAGVYVAVADGFFALLKPLSAGNHTIHIKGGTTDGFAVDVTYHLEVVEPGPIVPRQ